MDQIQGGTVFMMSRMEFGITQPYLGMELGLKYTLMVLGFIRMISGPIKPLIKAYQ